MIPLRALLFVFCFSLIAGIVRLVEPNSASMPEQEEQRVYVQVLILMAWVIPSGLVVLSAYLGIKVISYREMLKSIN